MRLPIPFLAVFLACAPGPESAPIGPHPESGQTNLALVFAVGALGTARSDATATRLPNGKVLVTGGVDATGALLSSCEIYDPISKSWSPAASLASARYGHQAVWLPGLGTAGGVLVAGGTLAFGAVASHSSEIYDYANGTWSSGGSMSHGHTGFTLLNANGNAYAIAGLDWCGQMVCGNLPTSAVDIYTPGTGWSSGPTLSRARYGHGAVFDPINGAFLVMGGFGSGSTVLASVEAMFLGNNWFDVSSMATARYQFGYLLVPNTSRVWVAGGIGINTVLAATESADMTSLLSGGSWTQLASSLTTPVYSNQLFATAQADNTIVSLSGYDGNNTPTAATSVIHTIAGVWGSGESLKANRAASATTMLDDGSVVVAGGTDGISTLATTDVWDWGRWRLTAAMSTPRAGHGMTILADGRVLVAGGHSGTAHLSSAEIYSPNLQTWKPTKPMSITRDAATLNWLGSGDTGAIVVGGYASNSVPVASAEVFKPATGAWGPTASMAFARAEHFSVLVKAGTLLVCGGQGVSGNLRSCEKYSTGTWSPTGTMSITHRYGAMLRHSTGDVYVFGGDDNNGATSGTVERYHPSSGTWVVLTSLSFPRDEFTATELDDHRVLIAGGIVHGTNGVQPTEIYNVSGSGSSVVGPAMLSPRDLHAAVLVPGLGGGLVMAVGGSSLTSYAEASTEVFDPGASTWLPAGSLSFGRWWPGVIVLADHSILVAGGYDANSVPLAACEVFR